MGSKKSGADEEDKAMSDSKPKQTLIEAGTKFTGAFNSDNPIVVRGGIEGEISGPSLTVAETGTVSGKVKVKELHSEGELAGEYEADVVHLSGRVRDNTVILAQVLEVKLAAEKGQMQVVFGEVDLEVGDVPSMAEAVEEAKRSVEDARASIAPAAQAAEGSDEEDAPTGVSPRPTEDAESAAESAETASSEGEEPATNEGSKGSGKRGKKRRSEAPPPAE